MVTIVARDLSVTLGRALVVDGIDAQFSGGTFVGIVGPNGAGKSSFVRALLGLVPSAGDVIIDGKPLAGLRRSELARHIAYLPQGQTLHWPLLVERLVALGRLPHLGPLSHPSPADRAAVVRAMAEADVAHLAGRTATELSGGERARVLLARALAVEAPALIADEPLTSLDPGHQLDVMTLMRRAADTGTLVIAVLHDLALAARFCDRLLMIAGGRLIADGPSNDVLTPDRLRDVYGVTAFVGQAGGVPIVVPLDRHD